MAELVFQNVTFSYPNSDQPVIEDMSLTVANGEAHALLGASGAGKTTLLSLMSGLLVPTRGQILLNGVDVTERNGFQRRIAQVFQFPVVYEGLTVAQNLKVPLRAAGLSEAAQQKRLDWLADELNLTDILNSKPRTLSLYQKQLLAVGKALAREDVAVVLLDEPLTAVEPHIKWSLRQTLRRAQADTGVTMVYVTHDQTEALTFADRVSLLTAQGLEQTGAPAELYENPANEYVANFVGSPGMNLLAARHRQSSDTFERFGFRPEWARIVDEQADLSARVVSTKPRGTRHGQAWGEVFLGLDDGSRFVVSSATDLSHGAQVQVKLDRWVAFDGGVNVARHGF